ncbi:hypothetical protein AB0K14_21960 [Actinosynnema sp. NPDC050801]|uniref:hypothetical protein n=1 Tax=unclassified Actinosynnema TaxID=2637065 RepID=UPI0033E0A4EE
MTAPKFAATIASNSASNQPWSARTTSTKPARPTSLFDQGHSLAATTRILEPEDTLAAARAEIADLRGRLEAGDGPASGGPVV